MTPRFTRRFRVRHYELDALGRVHGVSFLRYMQEAAIEASTALGFSPDWYSERGVGWVVRKLAVRYHAPAAYGDEVDVATWLSGIRGVRSIREYDLTRVRDGARVARGRAEWVYLDTKTGQPTRVPDEWAEAFPGIGKVEELGVRPSNPTPTENAHRYSSRRRVQFHELDAVQHVNHTVYVYWTEEAGLDALRAAGHAREPDSRIAGRPRQTGHEIQYFAPALEGESIEIVSWLAEIGEDGLAWTHEIYNADTRKLLVRDYSAGVLVDAEGRPGALSQSIIEAVLRGATG
ncbi:MAG TPA: thioesterase family protein [Gemmataceae bacterium]|jgi:acyl-CoA thioester hydrolase